MIVKIGRGSSNTTSHETAAFFRNVTPENDEGLLNFVAHIL
jgi:hypothetical protein